MIVVNSILNQEARLQNYIGQNHMSYIYAIIANIMYYISHVLVKLAENKHPSLLFTIRGVTVAVLCYGLSKFQKHTIIPSKKNNTQSWLNARNFIVAIHQSYLFYISTKLDDLSSAFVIQQLGPIFCNIWNYIFFGVKISLKQAFFMVLAFIGVLLITIPEYFMSIFISDFDLSQKDGEQQQNQKLSFHDKCLYLGIMLFLHLLWAMTPLAVKIIQFTSVELNFNSGFQFIYVGAFQQIFFQNKDNLEAFQFSFSELLFMVFGIGFVVWISQIFWVKGQLMTTDTGKFVLTTYSNCICAYLVDIIFFGKIPQFLEICGILVLLYSLYVILVKSGNK